MPAANSSSEHGVAFDREKFLAVVHHIIAECRDTSVLGKTKLHKCLYYADMISFISTRQPLTGVEYVKAPFGPTARYLDWGLRALESDGRIEVSRSDYFGLSKFDYVSLRAPDTNRLSDGEKALLGEVISFVCERSAREISELSHARPWQNAEMGERISYSSAHLLLPTTRVPSSRDIAWAEEQAVRVKRA